MNSKVIETPRKKIKTKYVILIYNDYELKLSFPKEEIQSITFAEDLIVSTDTIYDELLGNQHAEIEDDIIHIQDNELMNKEKIISRLSLLQRITDSFSLEQFSIEHNFFHLIESVQLFYILI